MKYSIYKIIYYIKGEEVVETMFFEGLLRWKVNNATDWRFKEISGVRSQGWFVGVAELEFPVQYPIKCIDGSYIQKDGAIRGYKVEDVWRNGFDFDEIKPTNKNKARKWKPRVEWDKGFKNVPPVHKHYHNQSGTETCYYCDKKISGKMITKDHIYPKMLGFKLRNNMVLACHTCNNFKDRLTPEKFVRHIDFLLENKVAPHDFETITYLKLVQSRAEKLIRKDLKIH